MAEALALAAGAGAFVLGLAVFFLGLAILRTGVRRLQGERARRFLAAVSRRRTGAFFAGVALTLVLQSASLVTVVLMELVEADLVDYPAAVAVVLGGNVGAALTVQFLALRLYDLALPAAAAALVATLVLPTRRLRAAGLSVLGLAVLYAGIGLVSAAVDPLANSALLARLLQRASASPLLAGAFGCAVTAAVQSNGIANGLLLALGRRGLITMRSAAAVIAGANVGSGTLALLASVRSGRLARDLAAANALVNVAGLLWVVPAFPLFVRVAALGTRDVAQALANAHILFNLLASLSLLPVVGPFGRLAAAVADRLLGGRGGDAPVVLPWPSTAVRARRL
jgi:phosphate:Na+ symporter